MEINDLKLEDLLKDFNHPNPNINYKACLEMIKLFPDKFMEKLINDLDAEDITLRRKSVKALSSFGLKALFPLIDLFNLSSKEEIKISCLKVFVAIAPKLNPGQINKELIDVIKVSMKNENPQLILTLTCLLKEIGISGVKFLKILSKDKNILKAKSAITVLSEIKDPSIQIFLEDLIKDKSIDEFIKNAAIESLNIRN